MARCLPAGASERPRLLSLAGRIHLRAGDERGAELCFAEAEKAREEASSDGRRGGGDGHEGDVDAGLVHVAKREYCAALERFERAAAARPWDAAAANGTAVARMYAGDLRRGARALEEALTIHPRGALGDGEALVRNACSMYELAAAAPAAKDARRVGGENRPGRFQPAQGQARVMKYERSLTLEERSRDGVLVDDARAVRWRSGGAARTRGSRGK